MRESFTFGLSENERSKNGKVLSSIGFDNTNTGDIAHYFYLMDL